MLSFKKILFLIFILLSSALYSTILNVPGTFPTIQAGIDVSLDADTVLVQPGTYLESINYNGKLITIGSLFLTTQDPAYISSTIIAGNSGERVVTFENSEDDTTILTGFTITNGDGVYCDNSNPNLDNLIVTGNYADYGGGIYLSNSNSNIKNVTISSNSAVFGGGIYCNDSNPSLENLTISDNSVSNSGGGIYCGGSSLTLINSILWNDSPQEISFRPLGDPNSIIISYSDIQGGEAGIVTNNNGTVSWLNGNIDVDPLFVNPSIGDYHLLLTSPCIDAGDPSSPLDPDGTIADMGAYYFHQHPGPIWHISTTGSDITGNGSEQFPFATIQFGINYSSETDTVLVHPGTYMENVIFEGDLVTVGSLFLTTGDEDYISSTIIDGDNNGIVVLFYNMNSSALLCGFTITNGSGSDYGGGIRCYGCDPTLKNLIITGNSSNYAGGGILCEYDANPLIKNVTISDNSAEYGSGICCGESDPILENVTITGNTATGSYGGGGMFCYSDSNPSLINCIMWNDSPQEIYFHVDLEPNSITIAYSDIEGGEAGIVTNGNGTVNWLDGNMDTDPLFVDAGNGNYHLQSTSPCIDAGDPNSALDPDGTTADMGAWFYNQGSAIEDNEIENVKFNLSNYPNPFNPLTTIKFDIKEFEIGVLKIFNIKGQLIESHQFEAGEHNFQWDASSMSSGVYLYQLQTENITVNKKMLLLK